jgi:lipopolysaccharide assembly protein A
MQFLKTIFWVLIAVLAVLFSVNNWTTVSIMLWNGLMMETKLPVLLIGAFLVGLLPTLLLHRATRWSLRRKLDNMERSLASATAPAVSAPSMNTMPPSASPMAVPPGVS